MERGRRHLHRNLLQKHPLLHDQQGLRRAGEHQRQGLLRDLLRGRHPGAVLRARREDRLHGGGRRRRQGRPLQLHRPHRPARPAPRLELRPVADHQLHHQLRREDRAQLCGRHGPAEHPPARVPLRLLLDEGERVVQLHLGRGHVRRRARHAPPDEGGAQPPHLRVDQLLHRPEVPPVPGGHGKGLPVKAAQRRCVAVGPVAGPAWAWWTSPNPAAWKWYQDKLRVLLDQGVDCFKTDLRRAHPHRRGVLRRAPTPN